MIFFDLDYTLESEAKIVNKVFIEAMETDKLSSYGYSFRSEQFIFDDRLSFINKAEINDVISINYEAGVQLRYSEATQLQDFFTEPFARRDITSANINPNTVILSGAQTDPLIDGRNYWAGGGFASGPGGAGVESELVQAATFLSAAVDFGEVFTVIGSARFEQADFEAVVPDGPPVDGPTTSNDGNLDYFNWSINPVIKLSPEASIYGVYQEATTYNPTQGGAILGESNFGEGELMEVGVKTALIEGKLYAGLAYYEWEQSSFNDREAVSNQFEAEGVELELTWQVTDSITVITSYGDREIVRVNPLGFRTMPWGLADPTGANNDEIGVALEAAGLLNQFSSAFGGFTPEGGSPGGRTELEVPGAPQTTFKGFVAVDLPSGFSVSGGFVWQDEYWHNYDQTILIDAATIWNLNVGYETGNWSALLSIENLFDEEYFLGAEPEFGANTLITKAPGTEARLTLTYTF